MMGGWTEKELGEVYDVRDGTHDSPKFQDKGFPLITSKNLKSGDLNFEKVKYISQSDYDAINKRSAVHKGDVLFAMIGTIGNPIVVETEPTFAIKNVALFKTPDNQDSSFLKYYLKSNFVKEKMSSEAKGTTQKFVGLGYLRKFPIRVPPLPEQKRIVAILDEAFAGIDAAVANTEKNLANARELFESYLNGVFTQKGDGWVEKTIKEITSHLGDGLHGTPFYTNDGEYYFINGNNLDAGKIVFKERTKRVSVSEYEKYKKNLTDRTVLVSINGTLGNVAFYNNEKIILGKSACYFNLLEEVDKHFIKYIISSTFFLDYAHREATGATIKNVSLKSMRGFKVPLPPLAEQNKIVRKLDSLSKDTQHLESIYQQKLRSLTELKQSILQKAFAGELTSLPEKIVAEAMA